MHFIFSEVILSFLTKLGITNSRKSHEYFGDVWKLLTVVSYMYFSPHKRYCNTRLAYVHINNILASVYCSRFSLAHKIYYIVTSHLIAECRSHKSVADASIVVLCLGKACSLGSDYAQQSVWQPRTRRWARHIDNIASSSDVSSKNEATRGSRTPAGVAAASPSCFVSSAVTGTVQCAV
jgi:hypothetical protein